jgi:hypothetical protein
MNYLHNEFDLSSDDVVEVTLQGNAANVQLLDPTNFQNYHSGRAFRYFGGYAKQSPIQIRVPHAGHWHLVIDLGGSAGNVRASVRVLQGSAQG